MSLEDPFKEYTAPPAEDQLWLPPTQRKNEESEEAYVSSFNPDYTEFTSLDDQETRKKLEVKMIHTFLRVMDDPSSASTHRLTAAKEIGELLGKYAKAAMSPTIGGENVQVNLLSSPEKTQALIEGLKKAKSVAKGTNSGIKPMEGGKGI